MRNLYLQKPKRKENVDSPTTSSKSSPFSVVTEDQADVYGWSVTSFVWWLKGFNVEDIRLKQEKMTNRETDLGRCPDYANLLKVIFVFLQKGSLSHGHSGPTTGHDIFILFGNCVFELLWTICLKEITVGSIFLSAFLGNVCQLSLHLKLAFNQQTDTEFLLNFFWPNAPVQWAVVLGNKLYL